MQYRERRGGCFYLLFATFSERETYHRQLSIDTSKISKQQLTA
jgi:hypothetical protein